MKKVTSTKLNLNKQTVSNLVGITGGARTVKATCVADCQTFACITRNAVSVCVCTN